MFGFKIKCLDGVYGIEEDSLFFSEYLYNLYKNGFRCESSLDLGTGSGILALYLSKISKKVFAVDISREALTIARENARMNGIDNITFRESDLFSSLKGMKFDLIVFNPPYLPCSPKNKEDLCICGGKNLGIISKFLEEVRNHLKRKGFFLLLLSSLSMPERFIRKYNLKILARKKLFFEELLILTSIQNSQDFTLNLCLSSLR